jgi:hypothetical protein
MTKEEIKKYLANVHDLIANDTIDEAIDLLLEFCEVIGNNDLKNDLLLLSGRLTSLERNNTKGILSFDDYTTEKNKVRNDIITIVSSFEDEADDNLETIGRSNGKIIHNTPSKMKIDKYYIASVRIAKDTVDITKNFEKSENSKVETLLISPTMSVSLIDITGGSVFDIRFIGESNEQRVHEDSFTEWRFSIKPKEKGVHMIQLCANFIEEFKSKKSIKTAYFESIVTIISEDIPLEINWKDTSIKIVREEKDMMVPPVGEISEKSIKNQTQFDTKSIDDLTSKKSKIDNIKILKFLIPKILIAAISILLIFVVTPLIFFNYLSKEQSIENVEHKDSIILVDFDIDSLKYNDLKLRLEQNINVRLVLINKDTILNYHQTSDKNGTIIRINNEFLPNSFDLPESITEILVLGEKGKADGNFKVNLSVDSIYNINTMLRDSSEVKIVTKTNQKILFNSVYIKPDSSYSSNNQYVYKYVLKNGRYKISTEKQEFNSCKDFEF